MALKRALDIAVSAIALLVFSPLMAVIWWLVKREDNGPAIYSGLRAGRDGHPFRMYKFRTMVLDADRIGGPSTSDDDSRVTAIGRRLRRLKLDELPQLLNVLTGDMSLVGPRPEVTSEVERYSPEERELLTMRPGITDWASLRFHNEGEILRGAADPHEGYLELIRPEKVRLGLEYVRKRTIAGDLKILRDTALLAVKSRSTSTPSAQTGTFSDVTETWGLPASPEQLQMAYTRYRMAGDLVAGREALEVGCGVGMGLAYLRTRAQRVVGVDISEQFVADAKHHLPGVEVLHLTDQDWPFGDTSFDVVVALEMIYYVPDIDSFVGECRRVLRPGGTLMLCLPNRDRPAFNPSPHSITYPNVPELQALLERHGFEARIYGGFKVAPATARDRLLDVLRHAAVALHLIPRSMKGKAMLKRILYGRLPKLSEIREGMADYEEPTRLDGLTPTGVFKNLYAVGTVGSGSA